MIVKYGGSVLWATMVFFLVAIAAPHLRAMANRWDRSHDRYKRRIVPAGSHAMARRFRLTLAGALLLGRIFSLWNLLAYGVGIMLGMMIDQFTQERAGNARAA